MKEYTYSKKVAGIVIHQMFVILMFIGVYALGYLYQQKEEVEIYLLLSVIGLMGNFVTLAYLTNITGRKSEDDPNIYYNFFDKIYSDVMALLFVCFLMIYGVLLTKLRSTDFSFSSLMVATGTLAYIFDIIFLIYYMSVVRKVKGNILVSHSLIGILGTYLISKFLKKEDSKFISQKLREQRKIKDAIEKISQGELDTKLDCNEFHGSQKDLALAVNHIQEGLSEAVKKSIKDERMKADLITNVSHDIKTPLTSIINYVELLKRENLQNEKASNYIMILDEKAQRLKHLTEDLVEASKISSGNIDLSIQKIDLVELLYQTGGEFNERFEARNLTIITKLPSEPIYINADGRQLYRSIENLYTNAAKYALENTRVYVELEKESQNAVFTIKNVSKNPIIVEEDNYDTLTERFVRGERSRTTEGSGLGLSIAKNLTTLMGGEFEIKVDGDLFVATISFKMA